MHHGSREGLSETRARAERRERAARRGRVAGTSTMMGPERSWYTPLLARSDTYPPRGTRHSSENECKERKRERKQSPTPTPREGRVVARGGARGGAQGWLRPLGPRSWAPPPPLPARARALHPGALGRPDACGAGANGSNGRVCSGGKRFKRTRVQWEQKVQTDACAVGAKGSNGRVCSGGKRFKRTRV